MIWQCACGWSLVTGMQDQRARVENLAREHRAVCVLNTCGCGEPAHFPVPPIREKHTGETLELEGGA